MGVINGKGAEKYGAYLNS